MADWLNAIAQLLGQPLASADPLHAPDLFKLGSGSPQGGDLFKLGQAPMGASGPLKFGSQGGFGDQGGRFSLPPGPLAPGGTPELKELRKRQGQRAEQLKRGQAGTLPGQQAGQFAATADAFAGQPVAQQIMAQAAQKYGPDAAQVVGAVLLGEGGLGGAVGDRDISAVGSHGPFQFYGPGGQLDNYARARGLSLEQAGQQARQNPLDAAQWALDTYLGQPLQAGVAAGERGEPLLRRVLQAQNPGALNSPQHLQRYTQALQQMSAAPPANAERAPTAPGTPVTPGVSQNSFGFPRGAAEAACGPAAAAMFAQAAGISVTAEQVLGHAQRGLWSAGTGMFGPQAEVALLGRLGVAATTGAVDPQRITAELQAGRPVILSSPGSTGHYFQVVGLGQQPGTFILGDAVGARVGATRLQEIGHLGFGQPDTAIYMAGR